MQAPRILAATATPRRLTWVSDDQRRAIHAYFIAGHKNNIIAGYKDLTKADREVVDWFLFEQHTVTG